MDVILNSYHFFDDILPATSQTLANEKSEYPLFSAIADNGHRILVTDRGSRPSIMREYQSEARKRGLGLQLVVAMYQLGNRGIITIDRSTPRTPIRNLGGHHLVFIEDAIASGVQYFVTAYQPWLSLPRNRRTRPGLSILPAGRFIRVANRRPA